MGKKLPAKSVLIFSHNKTLILISSSLYQAAKFGGLHSPDIHKVVSGGGISYNKYYFRYINDDVIIDLSDIGTLKLDEYDKLCGVTRPLYGTNRMNRKNWKYKK